VDFSFTNSYLPEKFANSDGFRFWKAQIIFGPKPSQWWQPFLSKIYFYFFLKLKEFIKKKFKTVLSSGRPN
jgi:hypothetical protein